ALAALAALAALTVLGRREQLLQILLRDQALPDLADVVLGLLRAVPQLELADAAQHEAAHVPRREPQRDLLRLLARVVRAEPRREGSLERPIDELVGR